MTLQQRADAYAMAFAKWPASHFRVVQEQGGDCLYAHWMIGNDYRNKTRYYGAYPTGYLDRVMALFPDAHPPHRHVLQMFSGSLPPGDYTRVDVSQPAEFQCSVYDFPALDTGRYFLVLADPPYTSADAEKYGTPMVNRRRALAALAAVTMAGGYLVWLDTVWPMHRKDEWRTVGRICLTRSTNHRVRLVSIFERRF